MRPKQVQSSAILTARRKRIKEEVVRYTNPAIGAAGGEVLLNLYEKQVGTSYRVNIGEAVELLSLGINAPTNSLQLKVQNKDGAVWNQFHTPAAPIADHYPGNDLPFNKPLQFEELMKDWGFRSFIETLSPNLVAPTMKLDEGNELNLYYQATGIVALGAVKCVAGIRRFLPGAAVDIKRFEMVDGGLRSHKRFWSNYQILAATTAGAWSQVWNWDLIKNEAFRFYEGGVKAQSTHLLESKIVIDDPEFEYNKYFTALGENQLPYNDTYSLPYAIVAGVNYNIAIEKLQTFKPTIDVVKGVNKSLKVFVRDDGVPVSDVAVRLRGVRYETNIATLA